jgi:hypothetical protein
VTSVTRVEENLLFGKNNYKVRWMKTKYYPVFVKYFFQAVVNIIRILKHFGRFAQQFRSHCSFLALRQFYSFSAERQLYLFSAERREIFSHLNSILKVTKFLNWTQNRKWVHSF